MLLAYDLFVYLFTLLPPSTVIQTLRQTSQQWWCLPSPAQCLSPESPSVAATPRQRPTTTLVCEASTRLKTATVERRTRVKTPAALQEHFYNKVDCRLSFGLHIQIKSKYFICSVTCRVTTTRLSWLQHFYSKGIINIMKKHYILHWHSLCVCRSIKMSSLYLCWQNEQDFLINEDDIIW